MTTNTEHAAPPAKSAKVLILATLAALAVMAIGLLAGVRPAEAEFHGANGRIFFHTYRHGTYDLYSMNPDGSGLKRLTEDPAWDGEAAVSPNGRKVAFVSYRNGNNEIYTMSADGSNEKRLTYNAASDKYPTFSPDGKKIAFVSDRSTGDENVWVMNADGSGAPIMLTSDPGYDTYPSFSPDGLKILFTSNRSGKPDLYRMATSPENNFNNVPVRLTNNTGLESSASYSPAGISILYASLANTSSIWVMNSADLNAQPLTDGKLSDTGPKFSPDGKKVVFMHLDPEKGFRIYKMNADGSNPKMIFAGEGLDPSWAPKPL